jgi:hypothetical protein
MPDVTHERCKAPRLLFESENPAASMQPALTTVEMFIPSFSQGFIQ